MILPVKALFFDMFGMMLDWRNSIAREAQAILAPLGHAIDGKRPFGKLDVLHRENLVKILPYFGVTNLDDAMIDDINMGWHRLDAWPDVPPCRARIHSADGSVTELADKLGV